MCPETVDMTLRQNGSKPRCEAAAPVEVAEQRLPLACVIAQPEEVRVQRIRQVARAPAGIERVGGSIEERPLHEHEVLPRGLVAARARTREREVFQMERCQIALELSRVGGPSGECPPRTRLERPAEPFRRHAPAFAVRLAVESLDEPFVNRHASAPDAIVYGRHQCSVICMVWVIASVGQPCLAGSAGVAVMV